MRIRNAVAGVAALAIGALAGSAATHANAGSCDDAQTTLAMTTCLSDALTKAEGDLRAQYAKARAGTARAGDRKLLSNAQRAWFSYRASDCEYAASFFRGGTFAPVERLRCRLNRTKRRLADVRDYARRQTCGMQARSRARLRAAC